VRVGKAAHRPQHIAARQAERSEGIGASQGDDLALVEAGSTPQIARIAIRLCTISWTSWSVCSPVFAKETMEQ